MSAAANTGEAAPLPAGLSDAVGRLNHAGYRRQRHCTAFLVAPDTLLTADHCIDGILPADMHFLRGYDRMTWAEHRQPVAGHPFGSGRDGAALCLDAATTATPLTLAVDPPMVGEILTVPGYGRPRVHALAAKACTVVRSLGPERVVMDCGLAPGFSGSPALRQTGEGTEVVGIVSRSGGGFTVLEVVSPQDVAQRCGPSGEGR
ncbi:MAG: serine protease [Pseudomonadota bacterium]